MSEPVEATITIEATDGPTEPARGGDLRFVAGEEPATIRRDHPATCDFVFRVGTREVLRVKSTGEALVRGEPVAQPAPHERRVYLGMVAFLESASSDLIVADDEFSCSSGLGYKGAPDGNVIFTENSLGDEWLRFDADGDVYGHGEKLTSRASIYLTFAAWVCHATRTEKP